MGDGRVVSFWMSSASLNVRVSSLKRERLLRDAIAQNDVKRPGREALLLFQVSDEGRMALPLSKVSRLESFRGHFWSELGVGCRPVSRGDSALVALREMLAKST